MTGCPNCGEPSIQDGGFFNPGPDLAEVAPGFTVGGGGCPVCNTFPEDRGKVVIEVTPETRAAVIEVTEEVIDRGYRAAFGQTREEAKGKRVCVACGKHPTFYSEAGRREYEISGVCEPCFDAMFADPDEED